jgi:hypothetical protein
MNHSTDMNATTTTTTELIHPFERAGLGKAPFTCLGVAENKFDLGNGHTKPGGCCRFCYTGILYEYLIISSDNKRFVVGCECVKKTEDEGLVKEAARQLKRLNWEKKSAMLASEAEARLEAERAKNGGLTNLEMHQAKMEARQLAYKTAVAPFMATLEGYADMIEDFRGGFRDFMATCLRRGELPKGKSIQITCEILAKMEGRQGSKKFNAKFDALMAEFESIQTAVNSAVL